MTNRARPAALVATLFLLFATLNTAPLLAERPSAPQLLPRSTYFFVRVHDMAEVKERFQQTSLGKIAADETLRPLLSQLYGGFGEAFAVAQAEVGLSLGELLSIPQGEVCLAAAPGADGLPKLIVLLDAGDQADALRDLIGKGSELLQRQGARKATQRVGDVELDVYTAVPNSDQPLAIFERESTFVLTTDAEISKGLLAAWDRAGQEASADDDSDGPMIQTLSQNTRYSIIMRRTRGTKDERPQVTFFIDPIELARSALRNELGAQTVIAVLPVIGLDGLHAVGGGLVMAPEEYDMIGHLYVLLAEPRTGALEMIAPTEIDPKPEPWVPAGVASYMSVQWEVQKTYAKFVSLYDQFGGEGAAAARVQRGFSDRVGIDFKKELIDALDGRLTTATWMEKPARVNGQCQLVAARLKDAAVFQETFDKVIARFPEALQREEYQGTTWFRIASGQPNRAPNERSDNSPLPPIRQPQACLALLGDYIVFTDSQRFMEQAIVANADSSLALANDLEFKLVASKIRRQAGTDVPAMIRFSRPEEGMRQLYDLANDAQMRSSIAAQADRSRVAGAFSNALRDNPLPPFEVFAKHLAPSGGYLINDSSGLHFLGFTLKREAE